MTKVSNTVESDDLTKCRAVEPRPESRNLDLKLLRKKIGTHLATCGLKEYTMKLTNTLRTIAFSGLGLLAGASSLNP